MSAYDPLSLLRTRLRPEAAGPWSGAAPQPSSNLRHRICLCHPHYRAPTNVLLDLLAPDGADGGLDYDFAHTACAVAAGNRWDRFFTREVDGAPLQLAHGDQGDYYFQLEGSTPEDPYPTVPTF